MPSTSVHEKLMLPICDFKLVQTWSTTWLGSCYLNHVGLSKPPRLAFSCWRCARKAFVGDVTWLKRFQAEKLHRDCRRTGKKNVSEVCVFLLLRQRSVGPTLTCFCGASAFVWSVLLRTSGRSSAVGQTEHWTKTHRPMKTEDIRNTIK